MSFPIILYRGAYQQELLTFADEMGAPVDLTGCVVTLGIWHRLEDAEPSFPLKVSGSGVIHANQVSARGQATVTFSPLDTVNLVADSYWLVVWIRDQLLNDKVAIPPTLVRLSEAKAPAP